MQDRIWILNILLMLGIFCLTISCVVCFFHISMDYILIVACNSWIFCLPVYYFLADELGEFAQELKLSLFQLGLSPQIAASILMQVGCALSSIVMICAGLTSRNASLLDYMSSDIYVVSYMDASFDLRD